MAYTDTYPTKPNFTLGGYSGPYGANKQLAPIPGQEAFRGGYPARIPGVDYNPTTGREPLSSLRSEAPYKPNFTMPPKQPGTDLMNVPQPPRGGFAYPNDAATANYFKTQGPNVEAARAASDAAGNFAGPRPIHQGAPIEQRYPANMSHALRGVQLGNPLLLAQSMQEGAANYAYNNPQQGVMLPGGLNSRDAIASTLGRPEYGSTPQRMEPLTERIGAKVADAAEWMFGLPNPQPGGMSAINQAEAGQKPAPSAPPPNETVPTKANANGITLGNPAQESIASAKQAMQSGQNAGYAQASNPSGPSYTVMDGKVRKFGADGQQSPIRELSGGIGTDQNGNYIGYGGTAPGGINPYALEAIQSSGASVSDKLAAMDRLQGKAPQLGYGMPAMQQAQAPDYSGYIADLMDKANKGIDMSSLGSMVQSSRDQKMAQAMLGQVLGAQAQGTNAALDYNASLANAGMDYGLGMQNQANQARQNELQAQHNAAQEQYWNQIAQAKRQQAGNRTAKVSPTEYRANAATKLSAIKSKYGPDSEEYKNGMEWFQNAFPNQFDSLGG